MPTRHLLRASAFAPAMNKFPLMAVDIGARGGAENDLLPIAFATDVLSFEPDPQAFEALQARDDDLWRSETVVPKALSDAGGEATLNIMRDPVSSTLLKPDISIGERFNKMQFFDVVGQAKVETITLDDAVSNYAPRHADYIKIDVEGAEDRILGASGATTMKNVLAIKVEVSALRARHEQAVFSELDQTLRHYGLELMDVVNVSHWRHHGYQIAPQFADEKIPFSRGQWIQADAFYMRPAAVLGDDGAAALRAAWLAMAHGFFDTAEEYLSIPQAQIALSDALDVELATALRETSMLYGRIVRRRALFSHVRRALGLIKNSILRSR